MNGEELTSVYDALELAEERIKELSGWAKVKAEGETLDAVINAKKLVWQASLRKSC